MRLTLVLCVCVLLCCVGADSRDTEFNLRTGYSKSPSPTRSKSPSRSASPTRKPSTTPSVTPSATPSVSVTPWVSSTTTWSRTLGTGYYYGGARGFSGKQTSDGGYIVTGYTLGLSLSKWDSTGSLSWSLVGGDYDTEGASVVQTTDGGYAVCGTTYISNGFYNDDYILLAKFAANGSLYWAHVYGTPSSEFCRSSQQTSDGGYILFGNNDDAGDHSMLVIKTDSDGILTWAKTIFGPFPATIAQTSDGGYVFAGLNFTETFPEMVIGKLSAAGDLLWSVALGSSNEWGSVQPTADGGFIVARSFATRELGIMKLTSTGAVSWTKSLPLTTTSSTIADNLVVQQTCDGGYILAGAMYGPQESGIGQILSKWEQDGSLSWASFVGTPGSYGFVGSVQQTSDGGYMTTGTWNDDISISKWNSLGRIASDCASYLDLTAFDVYVTAEEFSLTAVDVSLSSAPIDFATAEVPQVVGSGCAPTPSPNPGRFIHNVLMK